MLYVADDGHFADKDRQYRVTVTYGDGNSWSAPVETGPSAPVKQAKPPKEGAAPVRMSAVLKGI